jgi:predicted  nucleic acid-binding Zn-ribbon protein
LTIPDQIRALEELAAIDADLKILDDQLAQERTALEGLKSSLKRLDDKLAADRAQFALFEKSRNEFIGEVRTLTGQIEHSRDKMNRARNERETNAAQRELEELRKLVRDREQDATRVTTDAEALKVQIDATDKEAQVIREQLGSTEGSANARIAEVEAKRGEEQAKRDVAQKNLPPALFRRYENVRAKKGTGIAQTTDGTCRACHMALPPQLFHRLRREPLLEQCPSCFRIIYFVPPPAANPA